MLSDHKLNMVFDHKVNIVFDQNVKHDVELDDQNVSVNKVSDHKLDTVPDRIVDMLSYLQVKKM